VKQCTVLGGQGYIGRHLVQHLLAQGWTCHVPKRGDETYLLGELGTVFYCVGLTADFRTRPMDTVEAHVGLLQRVLREAHFERLVYLSSTRVYLAAANTDEDQALHVLPQDPDDIYKLSKLMGESLALNSGRPCVVARLSNVVGGNAGNAESFVYSLLKDAYQGRVVLRSDPQTAKDYIHIDDVVGLLQRVAQGSKQRIYNFASGVQVTHAQWLQRIVQATGCEYEVVPSAPHHAYMPIHVERIRDEFDFQPRATLEALCTMTPPSQT